MSVGHVRRGGLLGTRRRGGSRSVAVHPLFRHCVLLGIAGVIAALGPAASVAAASFARGHHRHANAAAVTPMCTTAKLVVWLDTEGNGAAGSTFYDLEFTNLANKSCVLQGYPGVSAVNLAGHQLGNAALRNAAFAATPVTLQHDASAKAVLQMVDTGNYPRQSCRSGTAAGLRVYPPGQATSKVVPYPFGACMIAGENDLQVEPVAAQRS